jgi:predicted ester cyclase
MSTQTVMLARRWFEEVWNQKRDDTMDEMLSPTCAGLMEGKGEIESAEAFKAARARLLAAFPDLCLTVEDTVAEGDKVVVRWVACATHCGADLGPAPTGCRCDFRGMTWLEFRDGKVVRGWDSWDIGGLLQRLQSAEPHRE